MVVSNVMIEDSLCRFLDRHGNNRVKRELLLFWVRHPNAKFNRSAICYAAGCNKQDAERALMTMVEGGLLDTCPNGNGVTLYSLTRKEDIRRPVLELATLGWGRWQLMLERAKNELARCQLVLYPEMAKVTGG